MAGSRGATRAEISYALAEINLEITGYFWKSSRNQLKGNQKSEVSRAAHAQAHGYKWKSVKSLWKSEITLKLGRNLEIWKSGNLEITWKSGDHAEIWKSRTHETLVSDPSGWVEQRGP